MLSKLRPALVLIVLLTLLTGLALPVRWSPASPRWSSRTRPTAA